MPNTENFEKIRRPAFTSPGREADKAVMPTGMRRKYQSHTKRLQMARVPRSLRRLLEGGA